MLRIVPHTVPRVGRSYEHFPDGFELHLGYTLNNRSNRGEESTSLLMPSLRGSAYMAAVINQDLYMTQGSLANKDTHRPKGGPMLLGIGLL